MADTWYPDVDSWRGAGSPEGDETNRVLIGTPPPDYIPPESPQNGSEPPQDNGSPQETTPETTTPEDKELEKVARSLKEK